MSPSTIRGLEKEVEELTFRGFRKELWFRVGGGGGGTVLVCSCGGGGGFCDVQRMVKMVPYEAFACPCGSGDVVLRESYKPKTREEQVRLLVGSPGASTTPIYSPGSSSTPIYSSRSSSTPIYSLGSSSTPIYSPRSSTPPRYSLGALTPQNYSAETSRNAECSNCKHLLDKITVL
ncbi:hypothetical protein Tco_1416857 [Tanacetum coccineum]